MEIVNNLSVWLLAMLLKELVLISSYTSYVHDSGFTGPIVPGDFQIYQSVYITCNINITFQS